MSISTIQRWPRFIVGFLALVTILLAPATPAAAHTGFDSSSPADGASVAKPVSEISLTFSGEATPAGEGFVILDTDGTVRVPDEVVSIDNLTWILRFDDVLGGGEVGVRWSVAAPDAHPIDGSFSFTITALASNAAAAQPTTVPSAAVAPTTAETDTEPESGVDTVEPEADQQGAGTDSVSKAIALDDFLDTTADSAQGAGLVAGVSRILRLIGAIGAIGGIVFAAFVLRGDRRDIRAVLFLVRRSGVLVVVGALTQAAAQVATSAQSWSGLWSLSTAIDTLWSSLGLAIGLRLVAGSLIWFGPQLRTDDAARASDPVSAVKQLTSVGSGRRASSVGPGNPGSASEHLVRDGDRTWELSSSPAAFVGVALLALSFLFDGHTVSEGPRWLHAAANLIHVMTAATWAGGVVMLAVVIARRHRRGADLRALQLGIRFSVVAIVALVVAAVAGAALTVVILDSVSEIWTTSWGRLLVLKVLLVAVAAVGGGFNHRVIIPELEGSPDDADLAHRFRTVVTLEAAALVLVTVVTALLIGASST